MCFLSLICLKHPTNAKTKTNNKQTSKNHFLKLKQQKSFLNFPFFTLLICYIDLLY